MAVAVVCGDWWAQSVYDVFSVFRCVTRTDSVFKHSVQWPGVCYGPWMTV